MNHRRERRRGGRRTIRLPFHDYRGPNEYFVTICTHLQSCLLSRIEGGRVILNDAGRMVQATLVRVASTLNARLDESVVMPNHVHFIIELREGGSPLPEIVARAKSWTTREYARGVRERGWRRFSGRLWQRGYFDRVIRNDRELEALREYVRANPWRWKHDPYYAE